MPRGIYVRKPGRRRPVSRRTPIPEFKTCKTCGLSKPANKFYYSVNPIGEKYLNGACKACELEIKSKRYHAFPDAMRERKRQSNARNAAKGNPQPKRKGYQLKNTKSEEYLERLLDWERLSRETLETIRYSTSSVCVYCETELKRLQLDHWVPWKRGGSAVVGNLIPACWKCNRSKSARAPSEWLFEKFGLFGFLRVNNFIQSQAA